jgi:hypothetical protein
MAEDVKYKSHNVVFCPGFLLGFPSTITVMDSPPSCIMHHDVMTVVVPEPASAKSRKSVPGLTGLALE